MGKKNLWSTALVSLVIGILLMATVATPVAADARGGGDATGWQGEYFTNRYLSGSPALVRYDDEINFNWGAGSPAARIPADNFSVRWTQNVYLDAGRYRFTTETDDGVRLWVDGRLVLDAWRDMPPTTLWADVDLTAGTHRLRMEYYEAYGGAVARLRWARIFREEPPTEGWFAEYYNNRYLSGWPRLTRTDPAVDFEWGLGSPDGRIHTDNFSVRWSRDVYFRAGRYRFTTETDDGVRLYIDGLLVIDRWQTMSRTRLEREIHLNEGVHHIRVEYFEAGGHALAHLTWEGPLPAPRGNLITWVPPYPSYSWIKVYRWDPGGWWVDMNPQGYASVAPSGYLKIDGLPVAPMYGDAGQPYWIEQWIDGRLARSVGNFLRGEPEFRIRPNVDNYTPW